MELEGDKNRLTIFFDEALEGEKVQIEPFRGRPNINNAKDYVRNTTVNEQEKAKVIKKLNTKLYVKDWYDPLERMELRGWYGDGSKTWAPERSGYLPSTIYRNSGKHEGLDLYSPIGKTAYACVDGEVYMNYPSTTYGNCFGIKGKYKGTVYYFFYAHLNKKPSLEIGDKVNGGDPIGETGITGNASSDLKKAHLHFEVRNTSDNTGGRLDTATTIPDILKKSKY